MDDHLYNVLHHAERTAPAPPRASDLIARVYRRRKQRRAVRTGAMLAILVAIAITPLWLADHLTPSQIAAIHSNPSTRESPPIELASLSSQIDGHALTAQLLVAGERRREAQTRSQATLARPDVLATNRDQAERAALTLLRDAERLNGRPHQAANAVKAYERTIQLFPDTSAATVAQARLEQLKT